MRFAAPYALALLPFVIALVYWAQRRKRIRALAMSSVGAVRDLPATWATRLVKVLPYMRALALALCVVALARPQWGVQTSTVHTEGIAIAMVLDISSSMGARDLDLDGVRRDRLEAVKQSFRSFVAGDERDLEGRSGDQLALITFARYADVLTPLTQDHDAVLAMLGEIEIVPFPEEDGTAIGDAIALGLDMLRDATSTSKVMIVLTDGSSNAGDIEPNEAARAAEALGIRIYTIGAGSSGTARIDVQNPDGSVESRQSRVYIDDETLGALSDRTDGRYYRATDARVLSEIYAEIDRLETSRTVIEHHQEYVEGAGSFILAAFLLLAAEIGLVTTRLRAVA